MNNTYNNDNYNNCMRIIKIINENLLCCSQPYDIIVISKYNYLLI